ncbi:GerMN domain-containing protein [Kribbella sp. NPDC050281]|uniref:GerMN domain-containing protein n=1 Tax=Kribbella sp. NPDC050281 TaxID=3155515 RepID=UPI0033E3EB5B
MKAIAVAVAAALVLVGCGVPVQEDPAPIDPGAIPSRLRTSSRPTTGPAPATSGQATIQVNFVRRDRLVALNREAPSTTSTELMNAVLQGLQDGPTATERAGGLTSALQPGLTLSVIHVQARSVVLELSGETGGRSAAENVLAVGQIVLSVTALPAVDEVTFSHNGVPVEALLADGALTTKPLTAKDYEALRSQ